MIKKLNNLIDILKKITEFLTYIATGYAKTVEAAEKISLVFVKIFRIIMYFVFGGITVIVANKIIKTIKKKKEAQLASAEKDDKD
ncbi:MAG: hypothetical protein IJR70_07045 [Eubacterium sp.]|nr:hypothetical protein [Eubacterium sp.]